VTAAGPEPPAPELLGNCGWCPVCQAADALRSENPEALAKIIAAAGHMSRTVTRGVGGGTLSWPGLLRKLDRIDDSFRS